MFTFQAPGRPNSDQEQCTQIYQWQIINHQPKQFPQWRRVSVLVLHLTSLDIWMKIHNANNILLDNTSLQRFKIQVGFWEMYAVTKRNGMNFSKHKDQTLYVKGNSCGWCRLPGSAGRKVWALIFDGECKLTVSSFLPAAGGTLHSAQQKSTVMVRDVKWWTRRGWMRCDCQSSKVKAKGRIWSAVIKIAELGSLQQ